MIRDLKADAPAEKSIEKASRTRRDLVSHRVERGLPAEGESSDSVPQRVGRSLFELGYVVQNRRFEDGMLKSLPGLLMASS